MASQTPIVEILRVYLAVLSALALFGSYWLWLRVRRTHAIPLAALLFAGLWISVYYGPEAMPNIWVAFGCVAATALTVLVNRNPHDPKLLLCLAAVLAGTALFRPSESVLLAGSIGLATLWRQRRRLARAIVPLAAIAGGAFLGWLQWIVEAEWTYGGFLTRLRDSSDANASGFSFFNWVGDLRAVNGPTSCGSRCRSDISAAELIFWLAFGAGCLAALLITRRRRDLTTLTVLPIAVASATGFTYFFLIANTAPRFLHPVYALAVIPCAVALYRLFLVRRKAARAGAVLLVLAYLTMQQFALLDTVRRTVPRREIIAMTAIELNRLGVTAPCLVSGSSAVETAYLAGCRSRYPAPPDDTSAPAYIRRALREGKRVAVISGFEATASVYVHDWRQETVVLPDGRTRIHIYLPRTR